MLTSSAARYDHLTTPEFRAWAERMLELPGQPHRKLWEWCFIAQALHERGMLQPGKLGLGFAVGKEPLPALFASMGTKVVATDLDAQHATKEWTDTNQHASCLQDLNGRGLCPKDVAAYHIAYRPADMRNIPADLTGFDFCWSACAMEHLGSIEAGVRFARKAMRCLKPGGVAVHTTEYNVSSNADTWNGKDVCIFRRADLRRIADLLGQDGHAVEPLSFQLGNHPEDLFVDTHPYTGACHMKLRLAGHIATSYGIIVTKRG